MAYRISTGATTSIASASLILEPRIKYPYVVWREGGTFQTVVKLYDLRLATSQTPIIIAGPTPPAYDVDIGSRFVSWAEYSNSNYDIRAYDLATGTTYAIAMDQNINEQEPATDGPWIVWRSQVKGEATSIIKAKNMDTGETRTVSDSASLWRDVRPTISGNWISYESDRDGNRDILIYNLSTAGTFKDTSDLNDQYLNDVFGNLVAYVDQRNGNEDIYVSKFVFSPPVANAGANQSGTINTPLTLSGSGSTDPGGFSLTYGWSIASAPSGSTATLSNSDTVSPSFTPDQYGNYVIQLVVTNSIGISSAADTVTVYVPFISPHPVEFMWFGATPSEGPAPLSVTFDLRAYDLNTDFQPAEIAFGDGSTQTLIGAGAVKYWAAAVSHTYATPGVYTATATVHDYTTSDTKSLTITVGEANRVPIANAGAGQTVRPGTAVTLDGTGSTDPDSDQLVAYAWDVVSYPANTTVPLSFTGSMPPFTPDLPGNYLISLSVQDEHGAWSLPATVTISTTNTKPVADAGPDQAITRVGTQVQLNGATSYDLDGDIITYQWGFRSQPVGSAATLNNSTSATPSFVPLVYGDYVLHLTVRDKWAASDPDTITVSFANVKPVANAGVNQSVQVPVKVQLDGSGSTDANNDVLAFSWNIVTMPTGSGAQLSNPAAVNPSFQADLPGTYVLSLTVNDGIEKSDPSSATILGTASTSSVIGRLREAIGAFNKIPPDLFKNPNMQNALTNKINAVIASIDAGLYLEALNQLQSDILPKTDGCATSSAPDKNDMIKDCASQDQVYPILIDAIRQLKAVLGLP